MEFELIARTSAILLFGGLLAALLGRGAPSTRHLVWHCAIVAVLLAPFVAPLVPRIAVPSGTRSSTGSNGHRSGGGAKFQQEFR